MLLAALVSAWIWFPKWQVKQVPGLNSNEFLQRVDEHRRTLTQLLGGLVGLLLVWLTWRRTTATEKNVLVLQEGQFTERFTRAIDQLGATDKDGKPKLEIRLGGIYALEQVAKDAPEKYHWTVMEVLTAYVRKNSPASPEAYSEQVIQPATLDILAIATVIRRRNREIEEPSRLNLSRADLSRVYLGGANLSQANLRGANLIEANLRGADLSEANLIVANLSWANLIEAKGLTQEQVNEAIGDDSTKLPESLERPERWSSS